MTERRQNAAIVVLRGNGSTGPCLGRVVGRSGSSVIRVRRMCDVLRGVTDLRGVLRGSCVRGVAGGPVVLGVVGAGGGTGPWGRAHTERRLRSEQREQGAERDETSHAGV